MSVMEIKKTERLSAPAKASFVLMLTQLIQKGLAVITTPIFTRLLTTAEYGQVSVFFSWYEILVIFSGFCLSKGVFNNGMLDYKDDRDCFSLSLYSLSLLISLVVGSCIIIFSKYVWNFMNLPMNLIVFMVLLLTLEEAFSIWSVRQRFEYKYKALALVTVGLAVISPIVGIICVLKYKENAVVARICGERTVFLLTYLFVIIYLLVKAKGKIKLRYWKYAVLFNLPLIPHYLSLHILNHMDRIQIEWIVGSSAAGIYAVAYSGASVVKIVWQSINASLIPWTYEKCKKEEFDKLGEMTKILVTGYGIVCLGFMFVAPEIMRILAPSSYIEGVAVIPSVVSGVFFSSLYYIFANVVYYYKKPTYVMIGSIASALLNVILNAIFIPRFGFVVAGFTTMISYMLQSVMDYYAMYKLTGKSIYDMKHILCISVVFIICSITLNLVYQNMVLRICLFMALLSYMLYYCKNNLIKTIQFLKGKGKNK